MVSWVQSFARVPGDCSSSWGKMLASSVILAYVYEQKVLFYQKN